MGTSTEMIDKPAQLAAVKTLPLLKALESLQLPGLENNLFSSSDWLLVIYKTYRTQIFVKYIEREGKVSSYIVYAVVKNFLEWKVCMCSYCDYCDGYVSGLDDWKLFMGSLMEEYPKYRITIRNLRDTLAREVPDLKVLSLENFHILDVRPDLPAIWKGTHDSFKAAVKQSEKSGVQVKRCDKGELAKFYQLHLRVRKNKYRIFPQPYRFFDVIWEQYMSKRNGVLLGAYDDKGNFLAGNIYLVCGNTLYYKFNTSAQDTLKLRPNNLLFWEGIKYAKERNLEYVDLGSSGLDQKGLVLFKDHTGATSLKITHLGYAPPDYKFSQKKILKLMTTTFTLPWMPDFMVRWGSGIIYPYLA